jgi:anti-anti-sigma factor
VSVAVDSSRLPRSEFGIAISDRGATTSITLIGSCDLAARPGLRAAIAHALARDPECVVLDLSRLSFIDNAGVSVVVELAKCSAARDVHLVIFPGPAAVQDVFARRETTDTLPFIPAVPEPGGALSSRPQRRRSPSPVRRPAPYQPVPAPARGPEVSWTTFFRSSGC